MVSVIIPAGGAGTRMGAAVRKQYLMLAGQPVLARTVQVFIDHPEVDEIVVAVPAGDLQEVVGMLSRQRGAKRVQVVEGGSDRQASVAAALAAVAPDSATVLVHDAVRPLVAPDVISAVLVVARTGAVSAARPVQETIKVCVDEKVQETLDRSKLWAMQTPQGFPRALLERAHAAAAAGHDVRATDDCALVERLGEPVHIVLGNTENIKLTTPADLALAQRLLAGGSTMAFPGVGIGYDVHRLVAGRPLYLGGVKIAHETGLLGHSDADVLAHAIMDAVLGAAGLGDIGRHFPDTDPRYAGASSIGLMEQVRCILRDAGLRPAGVDAVVIAERPHLAPHVPAMQAAIAAALGLPEGAVSVKATTTERLGFTGREEGIAAQAVARVESA